MSPKLQGVLVVHACFTLSRSSLEKRLATYEVNEPDWQERGRFSSCAVDITLDYCSAMALIDQLSKVPKLHFELALLSDRDFTGERWVWSPRLGLACAQIDSAGNLMLSENVIKSFFHSGNDNALKLERDFRKALLSEWDDEFEGLREQNISQQARLTRVG